MFSSKKDITGNCLVMLCAIAVGLSLAMRAETAEDYKFRFAAPEKVGRLHIGWGDPTDLAVQGQYAYMAVRESSYNFLIYDLIQPTRPVRAGMLGLGPWPTYLCVSGNYAYVSDGNQYVVVVDVSDPAKPQKVVQWKMGYPVLGNSKGPVKVPLVNGNHLYTTHPDLGVAIWDITELQNPKLVGVYKYGVGFHGMTRPALRENYLYVPNGAEGLLILDVSNVTNPMKVGTAPIPTLSVAISASGKYAYIAMGDSGLAVLDISNPRNLMKIGEVALGTSCRKVIVDGNYIYAHVYGDPRKPQPSWQRISVVDISNPRNPNEVGSCGTPVGLDGSRLLDYEPGYATGPADKSFPVIHDSEEVAKFSDIAKSGNYLFVSDEYFGLRVFDVSDPLNPYGAGGVKDAGEVSAIYVSGNYAYIGQNMRGGGFAVVDILNPAYPKGTVYYATGRDVWSIAGIGNRYIYVTSYSSGVKLLDTYDVSDPLNPVLTSRIPGYFAMASLVSGNYLYLGLDKYIYIFDLTDPTTPKYISTFTAGWGVSQVSMQAVSGKYLYVAHDSYFGVVDISDPTKPKEVGSCTIPSNAWFVHNIKLYGNNYVFVPCGDSGVTVVDVSTPTSPKLYSQFRPSGVTIALGVDSTKQRFYADNYWGGLSLWDISDLSQPEYLYSMGGFYSWRMEVVGGYIYRSTLDGMDIMFEQ